MNITHRKSPEEARKYLFAKGYVRLNAGSYCTWILKEWHLLFIRKNLVHRKYDGSFVTYEPNLKEFALWLRLYDDFIEAKGFGKELTEYQYRQINSEGLIPKPKQLSL